MKTYGPASSLLASELNEYQDDYIDAMYLPWIPVGTVGFYLYPRVERYPLYAWPNSLAVFQYVTPEPTPDVAVLNLTPAIYENFNGYTTGNLNGKTLYSTPGSWATSGATTDFAIGTGEPFVTRATVSDAATTGRIALAGTASISEATLEAILTYSATGNASLCGDGIIARYVDASNYLRIVFQFDTLAADKGDLRVIQTIGGTPTTLATFFPLSAPAVPLSIDPGVAYQLTVRTDEKGLVSVYFGVMGSPELRGTVQNANLATGGVLAAGRVGITDYNTSATARTRQFDDFKVWIPERKLLAGYLNVSEFPSSYSGNLRADKMRLVAKVTTDGLPITTLLKSVALRNVPAQSLALMTNPDSTAYKKWNLGTEYGKIVFPSISDKFKTIQFEGIEFDFPPKGLYTIEMTPGTPALTPPLQGARIQTQLQRRAI